MNVLLISNAFDTGGQGARIVEAFRKHAPDWLVRSMARVQTYFAYPVDLPFRRRSLEEQYQAADVIHARNDFIWYDAMAAKYGPKPVIFHAHGTRFRGDPNYYIREARKRGAQVVVSTIDLWLLAPNDATWLPAPYDVDWLASYR